MPLQEELRATPDRKARAAIKAQAHSQALEARWPLALSRGPLTLIVRAHGLVRDPDGYVVGFSVMVRAYRGGTEIKIDPHRQFINPPTVHNGVESLDVVFEQMLFDSIENHPNPAGWRP